MKILGISGSLRKTSFNTGLLRAAREVLGEGIQLDIRHCGDIPFYNEDLDGETKPAPVEHFFEAIRECDAFLFASPEYNHGIPGGLKNAIDWASRPAYASILACKPAAILSASKSIVGGARMQTQLHEVLGSTLTPIYPHPEFLVPLAPGKFDDAGRLTDPETRDRLKQYLDGFTAWAAGLKDAMPRP